MNVICPTCNKTYQIQDDKLPASTAGATCKNCGGRMVIEASGAFWAGDGEKVFSGGSKEIPSSGDKGIALEILDDYPELREIFSEKLMLKEILSPDKKGRYKSRKNKLKVKILMALSGVLDKALKDGEKVMRVGKGTAYYPAELFLGNGWLTMMYNHYAILATDRRILCINIDAGVKRTTHYIFQIACEDIKEVKRGLLGTVAFVRRRSKKRVFTRVSRHISKDLKDFIMEKTASITEPPKEVLEHICPSCFTPLKKGLDSCPACKASFKEPRKASLRSLLLPGLGDLYLGHRALGALELAGSMLVWVYAVSLVVSGQNEGLFVALFLLLFYNGLDGTLTYFMAKKANSARTNKRHWGPSVFKYPTLSSRCPLNILYRRVPPAIGPVCLQVASSVIPLPGNGFSKFNIRKERMGDQSGKRRKEEGRN